MMMKVEIHGCDDSGEAVSTIMIMLIAKLMVKRSRAIFAAVLMTWW